MPFAGHGVAKGRGVADEQRPPRGQTGSGEPSGDGPRLAGRFGDDVRAEELGDVRSLQEAGPDVGERGAVELCAAEDAEPDVGGAAGEGERPRVPREQVGVEPDGELGGSPVRHATDVLAKRVPVAAVAGSGGAKRLAQRRPHAVCADHVRCGQLAQAIDPEGDAGRARVGRSQRRSLVHRDAGVLGERQHRGVELGPPGDRRVRAPPTGQLEGDRPTRGATHHDVVDHGPGRHVRGLEPQVLEVAQRAGGQAVAAALVAGERGLVDQGDAPPGPSEGDRRSGAGRSTPDDGDVGVRSLHGATLLCREARAALRACSLRLRHLGVGGGAASPGGCAAVPTARLGRPFGPARFGFAIWVSGVVLLRLAAAQRCPRRGSGGPSGLLAQADADGRGRDAGRRLAPRLSAHEPQAAAGQCLVGPVDRHRRRYRRLPPAWVQPARRGVPDGQRRDDRGVPGGPAALPERNDLHHHPDPGRRRRRPLRVHRDLRDRSRGPTQRAPGETTHGTLDRIDARPRHHLRLGARRAGHRR